MKLNGSKIIVASVLLSANMVQADGPALIEFQAGTPALAAEVNSNFSALKVFGETTSVTLVNQGGSIVDQGNKISALEQINAATKIEALEAEIEQLQALLPRPYDIEVKADGVLIGHTNSVQYTNQKPYIAVKTDYGMIAIIGGYNSNFNLYEYDDLRNERGSQSSVYFSDAACADAVFVLEGGQLSASLFITEVANVVDNTKVIVTEQSAYLMTAGTVFNRTTTEYYQPHYSSGVCELYDIGQVGHVTIPVTLMTKEEHGFTSKITNLEIAGFVVN